MIPDKKITASSKYDVYHEPKQGRLNLKKITGSAFAGSWSAGTNDVHQWLQVDLGDQLTNITRVATQGRNGYTPGQWVTKYKLQ